MARISIYMFTMFSTFSVMVFFLPLYLTHQGMNSAQIGTVIGWGAFISMIAQPFWGVVSDRMKTIKLVLIVIIVGSLLLSTGMFAAETVMLIGLLYVAFMFFYGAAASISETLCVALAAERGLEFGKLRLWGEFGVGFSAVGLGLLVTRTGIGSIGTIFAAAIVVALVAALMLRDAKATPDPVNLAAFGRMFRQPKLLWFLALVLMIAIPHRMNDSMLAIHLERIGGSEAQLGLAWSIAAFCNIPLMLYAGRFIRRFSELGVFIAAAVIYIVRWVVVSQAASPEMLVAVQVLQGITFPLFLVSSVQYIQKLVPVELRATGMAMFAVTFIGFGGLLGSSIGGSLMEQYGPETTYGASAVMVAVCAAAAAATYLWRRRRDGLPQAS
jgi:MFS transporter, PPP family, 3-phenylpropionic acid transporter